MGYEYLCVFLLGFRSFKFSRVSLNSEALKMAPVLTLATRYFRSVLTYLDKVSQVKLKDIKIHDDKEETKGRLIYH